MPMKTTLLLIRVGAGLAAVLLVLAATARYGVGATPDSAAYISAARSLLAGRGFEQFDGSPFLNWPPIFPAVLALPGLLGRMDPFAAARYIQAILFGLLVLAGSGWFGRNIRSRPLVILGTILLVVSVPLAGVSCYAWSETLFCLLVALFLPAIGKSLEAPGLRQVLLAAILAMFAALTRYAGVTVILTGVVLLLFRRNAAGPAGAEPGAGHSSGAGPKPAGPTAPRLNAAGLKAASIVLFGVISALPLTLWCLRNHRLSSTFLGERVSSTHPFRENLLDAVRTLGAWMAPIPDSPRRLGLLLAAAPLGIIGFLFVMILHRVKRMSAAPIPGAADPHRVDLLPAAVFGVLYSGHILASAGTVSIDPIGDRLLAPVFVPLAWIVVYTLDNLPALGRVRRAAGAWCILAVILMAGWLGYSAFRTANRVMESARRGAGSYSTESWQTSDLMERLRRHPLSGRIYSNAPAGLFLATGTGCRLTPTNDSYRGPNRALYAMARFRQDLASPGPDVSIVWFNAFQKPYLCTPSEIGAVVGLEPVIEAREGTVYRVRR